MVMRRLVVLLLISLALSGCVRAKIEQFRESPVAVRMSAGDAVVVMGRRHHGAHEAEESFTSCVARSLQGSRIAVYPEQDFVDALYPWLEPRTAPKSAERLNQLLDLPVVEKRLHQTGVRFMVWIDGETDTVDRKGAMSCALSPAGGGCLGLTWWDRKSEYTATIWDVRDRQVVGKAKVDATGTSVMPAVIIPIPMIARTEAAACDGVATQLKELLQPQLSAG
ncbi:MAG: hypothetical protein ACPGZP_02725 [Panacagrimonas sp.]